MTASMDEEAPAMESMRWVGVDVHAKESLAAVLEPATGEINTQRITGRPGEAVLEWLATVAPPFRAVYEAGPTGYGLVRRARERGLDVVVCAPGHILKNATDHIKVDKRDAVRLARLLSAGELRLVRVPEPDEEHLRDLVRSREDLRVDLTRIRNRIGKFLLRREIYAPQHTETWGVLHRKWLRGLVFDDSASELVFEDAMHAHDILVARREQLERALAEIAETSAWALTIARLRCLRGIDTLSALGLVAEVGDFHRFHHPRFLTSYLGLVPSEHSSGEKRRQGGITKAGSKHARRLLVEAAWQYRHVPRTSHHISQRQKGQDPRVIDIAWRAQRRLYKRWQRLLGERRKRSTVVAVAVGRELAAFCWEIATLTG
jgi:transposase